MPSDVFAADEQASQPVDTGRWVRLARSVLDAEGLNGDVELSMLFVDEHAIADLNQRFHDEDGPTDVLALTMDELPSEGGRSPYSGGAGAGVSPAPAQAATMLGAVVLCAGGAVRSAAEL